MNTFLLRLVACLFLCVSLNSFGALLGTSTINFSAGGSPNTISGHWTASPLIIEQQATIEYFTIQTISFDSYHQPENYLANGFTFVWSVSVQNATIGGCRIVSWTNCSFSSNPTHFTEIQSGTTEAQWIRRLMPSNGAAPYYYGTRGTVLVSYGGGGGIANARGTVEIKAYGQSSVPVPTTAWLFGSALAGLLVARRKRS